MTHFPSSTSPFIGRQDELTQIRALLADPACRLLTLVGPGGIGKTRLAMETVQRLPQPASAHFILLQPLTSSDFLVPAIADPLGLQFYAGSDSKEQLLNYLREKASLLVLDNFEHLLDGAMLLSEILNSAPDVQLLVTSRERLNLIEEWVLELNGLDYPTAENISDAGHYSAVELFVQHAHRVKISFTLTYKTQSAIARVCRLVDGMPLGIELAAGWVRALSCDAIADEIERNLDILGTSARNIEPRHRTMRAAFEPTWARLSAREGEVFMELSVFRGGFTREAALAVAQATLPTLSALVDKSLLRVNANGRYDIHELLRQYAEERLSASGEMETAYAAHSAYYAAFLQAKWRPMQTARQAVTLNEIETEFDNIIAAWRSMVERHSATKLSMSICTLWRFCAMRGRFEDALALFQQAEEMLRPLSGAAEVDRAIGLILMGRAGVAETLPDLSEARAIAQEGLALLRRVGSQEDIALALWSACNVEAFDSDVPALRLYAEQMAAVARSINDDWLLAAALFPLSNASPHLDDIKEADRMAQMFSLAAEACGDLEMRMVSAGVVRLWIAYRRGDYTEAWNCAEQGRLLAETLGVPHMIGGFQSELGWIAVCTNDYSLAATHFQQSLQIQARTGYVRFTITALWYIGRMWAAFGRKELAVELLSLMLRRHETALKVRDDVEQSLRQLQAELPHQNFQTAKTRGEAFDLKARVQDLIAELGEFAQAPGQPDSSAKIPLLSDTLSEREYEVLSLIAEGCSNQVIANRLYIGVSTVKKHINHIYDKLDVKNRTQAVADARERGLLI